MFTDVHYKVDPELLQCLILFSCLETFLINMKNSAKFTQMFLQANVLCLNSL